MPEIDNSILLKSVLKTLYKVTARRTSPGFAVTVLDSIINVVKKKFDFLKYIQIYDYNELDNFVNINSDLNSIHPLKIGKAIEAIIQVVSLDLNIKAGYFFINEFKKIAGDEIISKLRECGVDLELLILIQQYLVQGQDKIKVETNFDYNGKIEKDSMDNLKIFNDIEKNISSWDYDPRAKVCIIYDKDGKELNRLDLHKFVSTNIGNYTNEGNIELLNEKRKEVRFELSSKEYELLKLLYARDVDIETAVELLNVNKSQINIMIQRLLSLKMLHQISFNEVELTDSAINHLEIIKKNQKKISN
jgi:hypothetical protein